MDKRTWHKISFQSAWERVVFFSCVGGLVLLLGLYVYKTHYLKKKEQHIQKLIDKLEMLRH